MIQLSRVNASPLANKSAILVSASVGEKTAAPLETRVENLFTAFASLTTRVVTLEEKVGMTSAGAGAVTLTQAPPLGGRKSTGDTLKMDVETLEGTVMDLDSRITNLENVVQGTKLLGRAPVLMQKDSGSVDEKKDSLKD